VRSIVSQEVLHFYVCLDAIMLVNSVFVNDGVLTQVLYFPLFACARFAQEIEFIEIPSAKNERLPC